MLSFIIFIILISFLHSKIYQTTISFYQFQPTNTIYLTKIKFKKGIANLLLQTKLNGIPFVFTNKMYISILQQKQLPSIYSGNCSIESFKTIMHPLDVSGRSTINQYTIQVKQDQILYFQIRDCEFSFTKQYSNYDLSLNIKVIIKNNDSHLNADQSLWFNYIALFFISFYLLIKSKIFKFQTEESGYAKTILSISLICYTLELLFRSIGYILLQYLQFDNKLFNLLFSTLSAISQTIFISLIILIAYGWTIQTCKDSLIGYLPWIFIIGILNSLMILMNKLNEGRPKIYHMYDSILGEITIGIRMLILLICVIGLIRTYRKYKDRSKYFVLKFGGCGVIYLLMLPCLIYITDSRMDVMYREQFLLMGWQILKLVINIVFWQLIGSQRSDYAKICYNNLSFFETKNEQIF